MKKNLLLIFLFALLAASPVCAQFQIHEYITYDWDSNPKLTLTVQDTSYNSVIIFDRNYYEYVSENSTLYEYCITHTRVKLITGEGIEDHNRVYIPLQEKDKILSQKARVIKKDGSVKLLGKEDFKEGYEEETGKKFSYFVFSGIETGCEIEYLYCIKRLPDLDGTIINIQGADPVLLYESRFTAPPGLWFKFKSYNGCPNVVFKNPDAAYQKDSKILNSENSMRTNNVRNNNIWTIKKENIPPIRDEDYSAPLAGLMKFAMKFDRISHTTRRDIYSYSPLAAGIIEKVYSESEAKDEKLISNVIAEIKLTAGNEEDSIRLVENYLKTNFIYDPREGEERTLLSKIVANKAYNDFGAVKLFAGILKKLNINTEIVLTGNRFKNKFDNDFECYSFLNEYLLYFPLINKFLDPANNHSRLGFPDNDFVNTYGLFTRMGKVEGKDKGVGEIKFIEGAKYNESIDRLQITAEITPSFRDTKFGIVREMSGYVAAEYQPLYDFMKDETKLNNISEQMIKSIDKDGSLKDLTIENKGGNYLGQKPLITKADLYSDKFIVKAGDKYLFHAGLLIGPQTGIHNNDTRTLPVEFPYCHKYLRSITFNIPDGYKVTGLDKLKFSESYIRNNDTTMLFVSDYKTENNTVTVTVEEYYKEYNYTVAEFEDYRRIANASENFTKVVLIFEKK